MEAALGSFDGVELVTMQLSSSSCLHALDFSNKGNQMHLSALYECRAGLPTSRQKEEI